MEAKTSMPANSGGGMRYAGFWIRFLAYVIDVIIFGIIARILFGSSAANVSTEPGFNIGASLNLNGWQVLLAIVYIIGFWIVLSATPGKMICRLKIIEEGRHKLSWQKALLRYVGYIVSGVALCIGFIWIGFDAKKQGWHDKIAQTYVVKK